MTSSSSPPKILLTGATGYIGGSVLTQLISSTHPSIKNSSITVLVRGQEKAQTLASQHQGRVHTVLFNDLDDTDRIIEVANDHDIVINTLVGFHAPSAAALIKGLGKRKKTTGKDVFMIHTSGTSNLADQPISGTYAEERVFSDRDTDIYEYETKRNDAQPYGQRTAELGVIDAGLENGVKTLVIMSPTIYGRGTGSFNCLTIQIPMFIRSTLSSGQAVMIGDGRGVWDHVHIEDLARLYELALVEILAGGKNVPFGKEGIIFSGNGRHTWGSVAQGVADAAYALGKIKSKQVQSASLAEGATWFGLDELMIELGFASNSRTVSDVGRSWGWQPVKGEEDWQKHFKEEMEFLFSEEAGGTSARPYPSVQK